MSADDENFLSRWSRRKREADEPPEKPSDAEVSPVPPPEKTGEAEQPAFDLASLPSLESITAQTDIRGFLQPGVPAELKHAALRRAWAADPQIRDFVGLAEYAWDFTKPDQMAGFGELAPGTDIAKLLADVFGHSPAAESKPQQPDKVLPEQPAGREDEPVAARPSDQRVTEAAETESATQEFVQRDANIATQQGESFSDPDRVRPKRRGGALPKINPET